MRRSKVEVWVHMVWATWHRAPLITPGVERAVLRCIEAEAKKLGCVVGAVGGVADHVHVVVRLPGTVRVADLAQRMKGVSSALARDILGSEGFFRWQDNYAAFSLTRTHVKDAVAYVRGQAARHGGEASLWPAWEETDEEAGHNATSPCP